MGRGSTLTSRSLYSHIWDLACNLRGNFKKSDYARIILPFMLLRRMECVLEPTKKKVVKDYESLKHSGIDLDLYLPEIARAKFYNTSKFTLDSLGSSDTRSNLEQYVSHFSPNARTVFAEFNFTNTIQELDRANLLYALVRHFANLDLHPDVVSNRDLSNAYEELIRKFAAENNDTAGEFMTPKDVVRLATKVVLNADEEIFTESGIIRTIYDPACGLLGFITDALDQIEEMGSTARMSPYGQELDPKTYAMALASMLINGYDGSTIAQGSTLSVDKFEGKRFNYCLANPPFGIKWEKDRAAVEKEHKEFGYRGRFGPGLPRVNDGSMLFLMHLVSKMETVENGGGRAGIVLSGSPLFTGDAGSGESEIRRWLLESDLVEAIIALPTDMFFNTGIGTYVWILSNKKEDRRKGKVQLIDLTNLWTAMRKSEGTKRRYLTDEQIDDVVRTYDDFRETDICKIFNTTDFAYRKVTIKRQLRGKLIVSPDAIKSLSGGKQFSKLTPAQQEAWMRYLENHQGEHEFGWIEAVGDEFKKRPELGGIGKPLLREIRNFLFVSDPEGDVILDDKGNPVPDPAFSDTETIPFDQGVEAYVEAEVLPYVPDAFIDYSVRDHKDGQVGKVGYEINFNRYFYKYEPPRPLVKIDQDIRSCEAMICRLMKEVV